MRSGCLVLCYHAVSDTWKDPLAVSPLALERQVRLLLARGYTAVGATAVLDNRPRTFHITFDDAFRSVERVLGALERLAVPCTIFACAGLAEHGARFPVPELRDRLPPDEDELLTMRWEMLRALAERGVEIGSHTVSHRHLPALDQEDLLAELLDSRERLEERLDRPCRFLAYPYGDHDARVRAAARAANYAAAFTLEPPRGGHDPLALPRVGVYRRDSILRFSAKVSRTRQRVMAVSRGSVFSGLRADR